ncbi:UNVERIFIED_CONTAM: hypothetical protein Sangu_3145600 [Sesamum angustifolium]|uniref:Uncharacterized protein n=1 Tax=Sesamum angustifolium TaxID=2727405 RepID=A0AAW2K233_9LAMI
MVDTTPNPNPGSGKQVTIGSSATQAVKPSTSLLEAEQREASVEPYVRKTAFSAREEDKLPAPPFRDTSCLNKLRELVQRS